MMISFGILFTGTVISIAVTGTIHTHTIMIPGTMILGIMIPGTMTAGTTVHGIMSLITTTMDRLITTRVR